MRCKLVIEVQMQVSGVEGGLLESETLGVIGKQTKRLLFFCCDVSNGGRLGFYRDVLQAHQSRVVATDALFCSLRFLLTRYCLSR